MQQFKFATPIVVPSSSYDIVAEVFEVEEISVAVFGSIEARAKLEMEILQFVESINILAIQLPTLVVDVGVE